MKIELHATEQRVIGCLIEKQITTPDQYPLSLNALTNACNQKSNRNPLMNLDEATVQRTVDGLSKKHWVVERSGFGSRVPKYQHRFCNTEYGTLKFSEIELAIVCELLVRGPQTPGELRTRASRMATVNDVSEIESALQILSTREDGPFVVRLVREPGRRDSRWAHLFGDAPPENVDTAPADQPAYRAAAPASTGAHVSIGAPASSGASTVAPASTGAPSSVGAHPAPVHASARADAATPRTTSASFASEDRVSKLEQEVQTLRAEIEALKQLVAANTA